MHYYRFNIGDYKKDTGHLSIVEHGVYRQLIDLYYTNEAPIISDIRKLSRLISARTDDEIQALHDVLDDFFTLDGNQYRHTRCDNELKSLYAKSEKARKSAQARWDKKGSNDANAMRTQCERNANACNNDANASKSDANRMLPSNPVTHEPSNPVTHEHSDPTTREPNNTKTQAHKNTGKKRNADIEYIFNFWRVTMKHPRAKKDIGRKKLINAALDTGYLVDDIEKAITGCLLSEWHMGANDRSTRYDGIHIILKNAENIDKFIGIYNQGGAKVGRGAEIDNVSNAAINSWLETLDDSNQINGEVVQ